ncbi:MAG TPA: TonB-dependent receptor, partial [Bacteroidia bacterium]|nr:TonB-dependent receptor [Bacteroidia bacterium]
MKKTILLPALLLVPGMIFSQNKISGNVKDASTGEALPGVLLYVSGTYSACASDADGNFQIINVKGNSAELIAMMIGYQRDTVHVDLPQTQPLNILLKQDTTVLEDVIIRSTRVLHSEQGAYTDIKKEELHKNDFGQDLPFLLNQQPSVVTTSDAGAGVGYTGIRIRGSDATRVNVTINGIPLNDAESQGTYWVDLPDFVSSTDNIQVQRGVGTS